MIVSSFNFFRTFLINQFVGTLEDMVDQFCQGLISYGAWYDHVNTYTSLDGVYIIHYEDLIEVRITLIRFLMMIIFKYHKIY